MRPSGELIICDTIGAVITAALDDISFLGEFRVEKNDTDMVFVAGVTPRPTGCHSRDRRRPGVGSCWHWMAAWDWQGAGISRGI